MLNESPRCVLCPLLNTLGMPVFPAFPWEKHGTADDAGDPSLPRALHQCRSGLHLHTSAKAGVHVLSFCLFSSGLSSVPFPFFAHLSLLSTACICLPNAPAILATHFCPLSIRSALYLRRHLPACLSSLPSPRRPHSTPMLRAANAFERTSIFVSFIRAVEVLMVHSGSY